MKLFSGSFGQKRWIYALLALVPALVYAKGLDYPFSPMDEQWLIVSDRHFLQDWGYLITAFRDAIQGIYYRPMLMVSLVIDYHAGELNPLFYHLSNLLFHILATVLLYRLLLLLKTGNTTALLLALLFSVHPVLVHAVEWVPGRNDSLLCVFSLLALIHLVRWLSENKITHAFLHLLFFALALLTKENAILLPLVFAALFFIYSPERRRMIVLVLAWGAGIVLWYCARHGVTANFPAGACNFANVKELVLALLVFIGKAVLPVQQSVAPVPGNSWVLPGVLTVGLVLFCFYKPGFKNKKIALTGLFMFVVLLVMPAWYGVLSPLGEQYEHRIYTPLAGLFIFAGQLNVRTGSRSFQYIMFTLIVLFAVKTSSRIQVYKTERSYLEEGIRDCPENYVFHFREGTLLYNRRDFNAALACFNKAIKLQQARAQLYHNRGNVFFALGKKKEAIDDYTRALKFSNNNPTVLLTRCSTYNTYGEAELAMKDLATLKACCAGTIPPWLDRQVTEKWNARQFADINASLQKDDRNAELYVARARLFFKARRPREALLDLEKACSLAPANAQYRSYYDQLRTTYRR